MRKSLAQSIARESARAVVAELSEKAKRITVEEDPANEAWVVRLDEASAMFQNTDGTAETAKYISDAVASLLGVT